MAGPHNPEMSWHVWVLHNESLRLQALIYRLQLLSTEKENQP